MRSAAVFDIMGDKMFKCREIKDRTDNFIEQLLGVWESSVRATHLFLSEQEIEGIKQYVPQALRGVPHLIIAEEDGAIAAFAGIDGRKIEMLFVAAKSRGRGIGRQLLQYAFDVYAVNELTVNEQNPQAIAFYEHMGFRVCKRSDVDEQGAVLLDGPGCLERVQPAQRPAGLGEGGVGGGSEKRQTFRRGSPCQSVEQKGGEIGVQYLRTART